MTTAILFLLAAATGAVSRVLVSMHVNPVEGLPWGTLLVNTSGSLALGLASTIAPPVITVIGVGGLGAYTTFSTFSVEVVRLLAEGRRLLAGAYVTVSVVCCVGAAAVGLAIAG